MNAANDSLRVIGIGRVRDDPKALELNFTGRPSDDDMRRIHDLLRDGPPSNDDALWDMLVRQAHERLGIGPDPGESPFDYLQRALQRVRPYGVPERETADNWQQYAKEGETAQACIERHRREQDSLLKLLAQAREPLTDQQIIALLPAGWTGMLARVMEFARRIERARTAGVSVARSDTPSSSPTDGSAHD